MPAQLTPLDATFLELEQADESAHMHIGGIMVFAPRATGGPPSLEEFCRLLEDRMQSLPRYRQRLSEPHTGGMTWPHWEWDTDFDLHRHVGRAALPAPGGERELQEWTSGFFSQRLDRHRPLWEMVILEGLAHSRWALATKTHHCMVDGVGSVDVAHVLLDATPEPPAPSPPESGGGAERPDREQPAEGTLILGRSGPLARLAGVWEG